VAGGNGNMQGVDFPFSGIGPGSSVGGLASAKKSLIFHTGANFRMSYIPRRAT
jgi:hypothetical protein